MISKVKLKQNKSLNFLWKHNKIKLTILNIIIINAIDANNYIRIIIAKCIIF